MSQAALRILHCVGFYFPDAVGGTEVHVRDLASALAERGIESAIVAATDGPGKEYVWDGVPVVRYPAATSAAAFTQLVQRLKPDVFHLHSWTTGSGLAHLRLAAQMGIPCVATLHVAAPLCLRGTMLLEGRTPCDGRIDDRRCAYCWALGRGAPAPVARLISTLPKWTPPPWLARSPARRLGTLASARRLAANQAAELQELARLSERIVVPSEWMRGALRQNAIPESKIVLSRQTASASFGPDSARAASHDGVLRLGFVGRLETYKGVGTLLEAMALIPASVRLRLIIAGASADPGPRRMAEEAAARDDRIELAGLLQPDRIPAFLQTLDVLAVPSRVMETGPIVVLEGQAMGLPVMGADLGGISERIRDGIDGWLLPFDSPQAWAAAIRQAATDPGDVARRAANSRRTRTPADVAAEMSAVYEEIAAPERRPAR